MNKEINYELKYDLLGRVEGNTKTAKNFDKAINLNEYTNVDEVIIYNLGRGPRPKLIAEIYNKDELVKRKFLFYGKKYTLLPEEYNNYKDITINCRGAYIIEVLRYRNKKEVDEIK